MTTNDYKEAGSEVASINPAPVSHAGEAWTENSADDNRSERMADVREPAGAVERSAADGGHEAPSLSGKFGAYALWRQRMRKARGGTLRARALGAIQSEPKKNVRPVYWVTEEQKKREAEQKRSAAAFFRQSLYGSPSGKCDLQSAARSVPGECGMFCAFCSSSRPCRLSGLP